MVPIHLTQSRMGWVRVGEPGPIPGTLEPPQTEFRLLHLTNLSRGINKLALYTRVCSTQEPELQIVEGHAADMEL
jgi:hypothetical protein